MENGNSVRDENSGSEEDKCRAVVLGAAIGDALSFPLKDYSRSFLHSLARPLSEDFSKTRDGRYPGGQFTDDTQGMLAVLRSIREAGGIDGETVADYLIPLWRDLLVVDADFSTTEALRPLVKGMTGWEGSGLPAGRAEAGALGRALPVGLWNVRSPESIPADSQTVLAISHTDSRVIACGSGLAAALQYALSHEELILGDFIDAMGDAAAVHDERVADLGAEFPRLLSQTDAKAWELIDEFIPDANYPARSDGVAGYCVRVYVLALYYFLKSPEDFEMSLRSGLRLGGDNSTTMLWIAALSAARVGTTGIPDRLIQGLLDVAGIEEIIDDFLSTRLARESFDPETGSDDTQDTTNTSDDARSKNSPGDAESLR